MCIVKCCSEYEWEKFNFCLIHEWPSFSDLTQNFFATTIFETLIQSTVLISIFYSKIFPEDIQSMFYATFSTNMFNISILFQSTLFQSIFLHSILLHFCHFLIEWVNIKQHFKSMFHQYFGSKVIWLSCRSITIVIISSVV